MKKPFKVLLAICALGATFLTTSCTKEYIQTAPPPDPAVPVLFSTDIQPFFNARCTNCHGNIAPNLESDVSYNNLIQGGYINLATPESSLLYTKINTGGSMEAFANSAERQMTLLWIQQGALNN